MCEIKTEHVLIEVEVWLCGWLALLLGHWLRLLTLLGVYHGLVSKEELEVWIILLRTRVGKLCLLVLIAISKVEKV